MADEEDGRKLLLFSKDTDNKTLITCHNAEKELNECNDQKQRRGKADH